MIDRNDFETFKKYMMDLKAFYEEEKVFNEHFEALQDENFYSVPCRKGSSLVTAYIKLLQDIYDCGSSIEVYIYEYDFGEKQFLLWCDDDIKGEIPIDVASLENFFKYVIQPGIKLQ